MVIPGIPSLGGQVITGPSAFQPPPWKSEVSNILNERIRMRNYFTLIASSSLDDLRGSYLHARYSVVPGDVFLKGRTGFGHSSIFSEMQACEARTVLASLACISLKMDECPKPVQPSRKTSRGTTECLA
ncbi:hypothetical protein O3M35_001233 [Rhynocoris fuscipes]|uniref:Uncharacterized protein n=1 Tax=Rhynocoris fuscipes TaxID=488301 RepID=A0AAW1DT56_9HEMI